jgi:hypothetical protein
VPHGFTIGRVGNGVTDLRIAGGTVVERTRAVFPPTGLAAPGMDEAHGWIFVLDPNGVQIEIIGPEL